LRTTCTVHVAVRVTAPAVTASWKPNVSADGKVIALVTPEAPYVAVGPLVCVHANVAAGTGCPVASVAIPVRTTPVWRSATLGPTMLTPKPSPDTYGPVGPPLEGVTVTCTCAIAVYSPS